MGILIVSSTPIELLADYELKTGDEDAEKIAHVYVPARRYDPATRLPRRYEPLPVVYRHGKRCLLHLVSNQEKEEI